MKIKLFIWIKGLRDEIKMLRRTQQKIKIEYWKVYWCNWWKFNSEKMENPPSTSYVVANESSILNVDVLKQWKRKLLTLEEQYVILMDQKKQGEHIVNYIKDRRQAYENLSGRRYWEKQTQLTIDILNAKRDEILTKIGRKMEKIEQMKVAIDVYTRTIEQK